MKVCIAGTSTIATKNRDLFNEDSIMLESFFYVKKWQLPIIKNCKFFMLDSGAFTFMRNAKKINWKDYVEQYIDFIKENDIQYFLELDIDSILGYENVKRIRKHIEAQTKKKCVPVWHISRGNEEWLKLCDEYSFVAIGGLVTKEILPGECIYISWLINEAHKRNCKVHGLGFTNLKWLQQYDFDSVDSTTWSRLRFGECCLFTDGRITYEKYDKKKLKRSEAERISIAEWIKFQRYAEAYL